MENDKTIKKITAADIERYHKGQLSAKEMHDLEKAALDDPFLADALEGYATEGVNVAADITDLKKKLADRVEEKNKTIPLAASASSSYRWWKVAAMIVLVAGAGFFVYQVAFRNSQAPLAEMAQKNKAEVVAASPDSTRGLVNTDTLVKIDTVSMLATNMHTGKVTGNGGTYKISPQYFTADTNHFATLQGSVSYDSKDTSVRGDIATTVTKDNQVKEEKSIPAEVAPYRANTFAKNSPQKKSSGIVYYDYNRDSVATFGRQQVYNGNGFTTLGDNKSLKFQHDQQRRNIFRGTVTDNNNNALPFANITNVADNVGTYTDAKGNFVLTSTDSVLNVQVKSIGFESNVTQLQNKPVPNQVIMQEDHDGISEVVISRKKVTSTRSRTSMVLEEPEPVDGWDNYDTYVANNLVVPETYKMKQSGNGGEVELSFEVNKNGEAVNITVKKSLCESCDKEAVRLIKEGPKWKRKTKKKRMTVTISF